MIESLDYPPTNEMSNGGQTAQCFYLKHDQCSAPNCSCLCHIKRFKFYEWSKQKQKELDLEQLKLRVLEEKITTPILPRGRSLSSKKRNE